MDLKLIRDGASPKEKLDLIPIYFNALVRKLQELIKHPDDTLTVKQTIFYGVRIVNLVVKEKPDSYEDLSGIFELIGSIKSAMSTLTPNELLTIFPLRKDYDGARYQTKDYFSSMAVLKEIGLDNPIGSNIDELLWDYMNIEIQIFTVNLTSVLDRLYRLEGHKGLLEEFFESQGTPLTTYSTFKDGKGRQFMKNNSTGEIMRVRKKIPRYLKGL